MTVLAVGDDGRRVISGSLDRTIRVWNCETGKQVAAFRADAPVVMCALAPDRRTVVASDSVVGLYFLRLEG